MARVEMHGISKSFGPHVALADFNLTIESGELICLLGPSGCGKTTALRILAGFERADAGSVRVAGDDISTVPVERRDFGMVFQDYSLFPNMTARENIDFGLKAHKFTAAERRTTIDRMLDITALEDQADKYPHQMSGGQKQRVALARAIATSPRLLLLDEPLSALDAKVRESLREEIRRLQREIGVTTVFVTHDQHEALAIADRVGVMSKGRLEQLDTPRSLYENPASPFAATFIGSINRVRATGCEDGRWMVLGSTVDGSEPSTSAAAAVVGVRPEHVSVHRDGEGDSRITDLSFLGPVTRVTVESVDGAVVADLPSAECGELALGDPVQVRLHAHVRHVVVLEEGTA
jgi:putative spermidine/putrescine transport system ATP-binding protein